MKPQLAAGVALLTLLSLAPASSADVPAPVGNPSPRQVTLATSKAVVVQGSGFVLTGRVTSEGATSKQCVAGVEVSIVRDFYDDMPNYWNPVVEVTTEDDGTFRAALMAENSANYRAVVQDLPQQCAKARSKRVAVRSRLDVTLSPETASVDRGQRVRLVATASPRCEDRVFLLKLVDGRFVRVASKEPNDYCVAVFKRRVHHDSVFRAGHPETGGVAFFYLGNRSAMSAVSIRD